MTTYGDAKHYYGSEPTQYVNCYNPPNTTQTWPVFIMLPAAGFSSSAGQGDGLNPEALIMDNYGAVFVVNYRGVNYTTATPVRAAFPMELDDVVAGCLWVINNAGTFYGDASVLHIIGGSAGGTLAMLATARLEELGYRVASCHSFSSNTDWFSTVQYYVDELSNSDATVVASAVNHLGNIANCYGVDSGASNYQSNNLGTNGIYTLLWHYYWTNSSLVGSNPTTTLDPATSFFGFGANYWDPTFFSEYSPAQRCSRYASRCRYQIFASLSDIEIPIEQAYVFLEALTDVGTAASVNPIASVKHGWKLFDQNDTFFAKTISEFASASVN